MAGRPVDPVRDLDAQLEQPGNDSWYMGANIPGKPRQLLNCPNSGMHIERLRTCAERGYDGFVFDT